eukprot:scaffold28499_cov65-Phaeocystis_antarctica.AAC.2
MAAFLRVLLRRLLLGSRAVPRACALCEGCAERQDVEEKRRRGIRLRNLFGVVRADKTKERVHTSSGIHYHGESTGSPRWFRMMKI